MGGPWIVDGPAAEDKARRFSHGDEAAADDVNSPTKEVAL